MYVMRSIPVFKQNNAAGYFVMQTNCFARDTEDVY